MLIIIIGSILPPTTIVVKVYKTSIPRHAQTCQYSLVTTSYRKGAPQFYCKNWGAPMVLLDAQDTAT